MRFPTECQDPLCENDRKLFCENHKIVICQECDYKLHAGCKTVYIHELEDVKKNLKFAGDLLQVYNNKAFSSNAELYIPQAAQKLAALKDEYKTLTSSIIQAVENDDFVESQLLKSELKKFNIRLQKDDLLRDLNHLSNINEVSYIQKAFSFDEHQVETKMFETNREILRRYKQKLDSDSHKNNEEFKRNFREECTQRIEALYQEQIGQLETSVEMGDQAWTQEMLSREEVDQRVRELDEKVKAQVEEIKREIGLREQVEEDKKEIEKKVEEIDEIFGGVLGDLSIENIDITMKLNTEEGKTKRDVLSKINLPNLKKLKIDSISDEDSALNEFLAHSCPPTLQCFNFNSCLLDDVDISYYLESMKKVLERTTKEIYFYKLIVSPESLCDIVKASSQCERLTICRSKITTSSNLDFSTSVPYKTKYLSFDECGWVDWCNMEWDKYPERFGEIIKAIKGSSLKDSLQTINIEDCEISVAQVNDLLKDHGLSNINVIEEDDLPLND